MDVNLRLHMAHIGSSSSFNSDILSISSWTRSSDQSMRHTELEKNDILEKLGYLLRLFQRQFPSHPLPQTPGHRFHINLSFLPVPYGRFRPKFYLKLLIRKF